MGLLRQTQSRSSRGSAPWISGEYARISPPVTITSPTLSQACAWNCECSSLRAPMQRAVATPCLPSHRSAARACTRQSDRQGTRDAARGIAVATRMTSSSLTLADRGWRVDPAGLSKALGSVLPTFHRAHARFPAACRTSTQARGRDSDDAVRVLDNLPSRSIRGDDVMILEIAEEAPRICFNLFKGCAVALCD